MSSRGGRLADVAHGGGEPLSFHDAGLPSACTSEHAQADWSPRYPVSGFLPRSDQAGNVSVPGHPHLSPQCPHHAAKHARSPPAPEGGESEAFGEVGRETNLNQLGQ